MKHRLSLVMYKFKLIIVLVVIASAQIHHSEPSNSSAPNICLTPYKEFGECVLIQDCPTISKIAVEAPRPLSTQIATFLKDSVCSDPIERKVCCRIQDVLVTVEKNMSSVYKPTSNAGFSTNQNKPNFEVSSSSSSSSIYPAFSTGALVSEVANSHKEPQTEYSIANDFSIHHNINLLDVDNCGRALSDGASNDTVASLYEFPWMALLGYESWTKNITEWKCIGTLINNRYVLTAASCVKNLSGYFLSKVRLGEYDLSSDNQCMVVSYKYQCSPPAQDLGIKKVITHPNYDKSSKPYDIALIRLAEAAELNEYNVSPICLPVRAEIMSLNLPEFIATGWNSPDGIKGKLMKTKLSHLENGQCEKLLRSKLETGQLCVENKLKGNGRISEYGGPLQFLVEHYNLGNKYVQFGITSFGNRYGNPTIYTHVPHFMEWILNNLEQ